MPKGACTRTTVEERLGEGWTVTDDLLALLVEISSVTAAERKLKKPIEVPRPNRKKAPEVEPSGTDTDKAFKKGIGVLAATTKAVGR